MVMRAAAAAAAATAAAAEVDTAQVKWNIDATANDIIVMNEVYALAALLHAPPSLPLSQLAAASLAPRPGYIGQV